MERKSDNNKNKEKKFNYSLILLIFIFATIIVIKAVPDNRLNNVIKVISQSNTDYKEMFSEIKDTVVKHTVSGKTFIMPVNDKITSPFGQREDPVTKEIKNHTGIDINAPLNTEVIAAKGGKVIKACENQFYGKFIMIKHDSEFVSLYGHLNEFNVNINDEVKKGDIIGKSGNSGNSTGPHLHFEIRKNDVCVDPINYLL